MTVPATTPARRFLLRDRTAAAHAYLDAAVGPLDSLGAYRRYLAGLHGFRAAAEAGFAARPLPPGFGTWRPTLIADLLAADAADLGVPLAPVSAAPPPATESGLLGLLYVLEGSALGARLLQRQAVGLGLDARRGARHLAAQTGSPEAWRGFVARLEAWPDFAPDEAAHAAAAAFALARASFEEAPHAAV